MAAASATATSEHNAHSSKQHHRRRGRLLSHLHIQVPSVPTISGWSGSGRPSGPATAPCDAPAQAHHHHHHHDRPAASPSLLRSPTAWIRSKGKQHTPRRSGNNNFHYDARSYARNFDDGSGGREEEDARKHSCFSPVRIASSPSSDQGISGSGGSRNGEEDTARETLRVME